MTTQYYHASGKRKTAIAIVKLLLKGKGRVTVNGRGLDEYFPQQELHVTVMTPLTVTKLHGSFDVDARVSGGGARGQAEALRLAVSKALLLHDPDLRPTLKHAGYLHRDPRIKERKKPGRHRARRGHQYSKR